MVVNQHYDVVHEPGKAPIKMWTRGVPVEDAAVTQLRNVSSMPFIYRHVAVMPDVHLGIGATVGSVIPTRGAIIPASVGVDLGCGVAAIQLSLSANQLPDTLSEIRLAIESAVPHGRTDHGGPNDRGAWGTPPDSVVGAWSAWLKSGYQTIVAKHPKLDRGSHVNHLGTLGTGNHFIEVCLDEQQRVWLMLHSGSRGVGNRIGQYFIEMAKQDMRQWFINLPDVDLAYLPEGTEHFDDYWQAVRWCQGYAAINRQTMLWATVHALRPYVPAFTVNHEQAISCHHNYVALEHHFGTNVYVTRKGAVRARVDDLGIIPGSMGTCSYIVRGKGNPESFMSCAHGAGRAMSRTAARKRFTIEDHARATNGVECRKDDAVLDETPGAYKPIDAVMAAQSDLIEIVHQLRQVVVVKG